jgi:aryl-alcohol dehydrogenase-like predicted oxidoreductase
VVARGYLAFRMSISGGTSVCTLRSRAIAHRKNATLAQLSIAWPMAQGKRAGVFIVPIPGAKSRKHIEENVRAADIVLTAEDLAEIDRIVPPGAASGTRYPIGQMHRLNV